MSDVLAAERKERFLLTLETFEFVMCPDKKLFERIVKAVQADNGHFKSAEICNVFVSAAERGHTDAVHLFLTFNKDLVDVTNSSNHTALIKGSQNGHYETIACLLDAGADVDKADAFDRTALFWSSHNGYGEIVTKLLAADADVNSGDKEGYTPLFWSFRCARKEIATKLIAAGADVNAVTKNGHTVLTWGIVYFSHVYTDRLIAAGADVNKFDMNGHSPLYYAVNYGLADIVDKLLAAGALITTKITAIACGRYAMMLEWHQLLNVSFLLQPLRLPVRVGFSVYTSMSRYSRCTVPMSHAWNVLRKIKQNNIEKNE